MACNVVTLTSMKDLHNCLKKRLNDRITLKSFGINGNFLNNNNLFFIKFNCFRHVFNRGNPVR